MEEIREYLLEQQPDYDQGVSLLRKHHKNRTLPNLLQRKENSNNVAKLRYELAKLIGDLSLATLPLPLEQPVIPSHPESLDELQEVAQQLNAQLPELPDGSPDYEEKAQRLREVIARIEELREQVRVAAEPSLAELATRLTPEALVEVEGITQAQAQLYREKAQLSNQLGDCDNRAQRYEVVQEIQQKEEQYNALAEKKRLVIERGQVAASEQPEPAHPAEPEAAPEQATPATNVEPEQPAAESLEVASARLVHERNNLRSNLSKAKKKQEAATTEAKQSEYAQKVAKLTLELEEVELQLKALAQ